VRGGGEARLTYTIEPWWGIHGNAGVWEVRVLCCEERVEGGMMGDR
jgi:hypothetical protein